MFKEVNSQMNLPEIEEEVLKFWDTDKTFEKSLQSRQGAKEYSFYDGPPFATGTPHYGHIVASTMKDIVPRYKTMRGFYVPRIWGWDCHGLPIENIAEKALGITKKKDIEQLGVEKFNEVCRSKVLEYVLEWKKVIRRLGRWADMDNAYKTMDLPFMESVWWVFKQLWDKGLIYEGYRSMHICPRCETTLSQSEVAEGYKTVKDLSAIAKFELTDEPGTFLLAWTTTPWTLIGNSALAVGRKILYVKAKIGKNETQPCDYYVILAKDRVAEVLKDEKYEIVSEFPGSDIIGYHYRPLFNYYFNSNLSNNENGWSVYPADFVTTEEGTGIVHIAPAFGEDDLNLAGEYNLPLIQHVGMDGIIKEEAGEFAGLNVKPSDDVMKTDVEIIKYLAGKDLLFHKEKYEHTYPHCWRCETPLLNYATSSWFVAITKIKEEALKLSREISWSPKHIKEGRFGKWLEGARDWSISRQRYWASVIPIWKCDCGEMMVFGSVEELEKASGQKVDNLHKDKMDKVTFSCRKCQGSMRRIPDVLDTWFDSGSMPYAQEHYPFENKEKFDENFPADFIAEGVDQTRAWFYYLHVLGTAIQAKPAFKNVIVNGIVLAEDGKKMSKRLQNYPDPMAMFNKYGADPIRLYLATSPVMQAENLNFSEKEVIELHRGIFRMIWNSYSFFVLYANIDRWQVNESTNQRINESTNLLDRWILSEINQLIADVNKGMESYDLTKSARLFAPFVDNLSNWYIRRSRKRFWKSENDTDKNSAYHTLYDVLITLSKLLAPFTPFLADEIYRNLAKGDSVHLEDYPESDRTVINPDLNIQMQETRQIVEYGLSARAAGKVKVRQPLSGLVYHGTRLDKELEDIIADEVNIKSVKWTEGDPKSVELDLTITDELRLEGNAREIIRNIQSLRKNTGFKVEDRIVVYYETDSSALKETLSKFGDLIAKEVLAEKIEDKKTEVEGQEEFVLDNEKIWIGVSRK